MTTPFIDMQKIAHQAMLDYGFLYKFSPQELKEAGSLQSQFDQKPKIPFRDLKDLLWSSIDNIDSQDLDQLEYCERFQNREIRVLVAVADVDSCVPSRSLIDRHAVHNGTSVYTGIEIFPMLPDRLSSNITSLIPNAPRLAVVIEFFVRPDGSLRSGESC